jgi:hypothetical protein
MAKVELKNSANADLDPIKFIESLEHQKRKQDAFRLLDLFERETKMKAVMWGPSMIGFGRYHYKYESGREGEFFMTGFSPRKSNLSIYIMPGYQDLSAMLERLGKHKTGKSCLYVNKLEDIDLDVLREIIQFGMSYMRKKYTTWDA